MRTDGAIITNAGQELLSYALANNKQVNFTKVKLGKGDVNTFDEAKKLTDVVSFYKQIPITSLARNNAGIVRIRSSFTNADFPLQVVLKEIGVFAVVEGKSEVLFGYVNDGEGESFPPGSSGNIVERVRDIYVGVSTNTQVTAVVDRSVVYATVYDLEEEIAKCAKKITRVNPGNGIHGGGTLGEDITVSIKTNDTSINLDAANGITLKKTTSWLNDAAQLFTAKGALNLFNTLTTNFTDAINIAKEALRGDIVKKLNKPVVLNEDIDTEEKLRNLRVGTYILNEKIIWQYNEGRRGYYTIVVKTDSSTTNDSILEVQHSGAGGGHIHQGAWNSGRWSGWVLIFTKKDPPSCDDVGAEPKFPKNNGWNLEKTDLVENDTNKIFSAKGAFDLKTYLVTNYTTLMNNIRDALTNSINTKLPHGGYRESGQQLKNEIDDINNNRFKIIAKSIGNTSTSTDLNSIVDNGFYISDAGNNKFTNNPPGIDAFELTVTGITSNGRVGYKTQLLKDVSNNKYFVRTNPHWNEERWTPWQQLAFDDEVYKRCRYLENGLPTAEDILRLEPGIYNVAMSPIFELPNGYYTIQRLNNRYESGDNTVIAYRAGSGNKFWITSFNSNRWTGWKEFNHCPYNIGDFYLTSNTRNPSLVWHGTSWELIEGRMLIGAKSGQFSLGTTGGNQNIKLTREQLPRHRFQVDSFNLGRGTMNITGAFGAPTKEGTSYGNGAFVVKSQSSSGRAAGAGGGSVEYNFNAATAWTGTTTTASPYTNYIGNDEAINIMNPYLVINIWKRIG